MKWKKNDLNKYLQAIKISNDIHVLKDEVSFLLSFSRKFQIVNDIYCSKYHNLGIDVSYVYKVKKADPEVLSTIISRITPYMVPLNVFLW